MTRTAHKDRHLVKLFRMKELPKMVVPGAQPPKPEPLAPMVVVAGGIDKVKREARAQLEKQGKRIHSINPGPDSSGRVCLIAYIY